MPGAEIANVKAFWSGGVLKITNLNDETLVSIAASTGLANYSGPTIKTVTTAATLAAGDCGKVVKCSVDGTFITLPVGGSTSILAGGNYTIVNTASSGGAQVIVIAATGGAIIGGAISTSNLFSNTKTTQVLGDSVNLVNTGSTTWYVMGLTGTWASTT